MNMLARLIEWAIPALREWRIEAEMADGGEDAVSARDRRWMERRNERRRGRG